MAVSLHRRLLGAGVLFGSLVLFGPLTYLLTVHAVEILVTFSGDNTSLTGLLALFVGGASLIVALVVVWETAAVRLHGFSILNRGGQTQRIFRHLILTVATLAATLSVSELVVEMTLSGVARGEPTYVGLPLVLVAVLVWAAHRSVGAFRQGLQHAR